MPGHGESARRVWLGHAAVLLAGVALAATLLCFPSQPLTALLCLLPQRLTALLGCTGTAADKPKGDDLLATLRVDGVRPKTLRIGMTPSSGTNTAEVLRPLVTYLERELGMTVAAVTAADYDNLAELVGDKQVEVGIFSPLSFVQARAAKLPAVPIATVTRRGSPTYLGYLVVRTDSLIDRLAGLRGKRVAWVSRSSTSGYLYPRALLREKILAEGESPDDFFAKPALFKGNHKDALLALYEGAADVAAVAGPFVDPGPLNPLSETLGEERSVDALRVIAKTDRIPLDCVVVRDDLERGLAERLRDALFALVKHPDVSQDLQRSWNMSGFVPPLMTAYEGIAAVAEREPVEP